MLRSSFAAVLVLAFAACGDDGNNNPAADAPPNNPDAPGGGQVIRLNDDIKTDTTLKAENVYVLPRLRNVFVSPGATLTIEPGTQIQGEQGSTLVITRGAKIHAVGTVEKPIVFTSAQPSGSRTPGFWGGLIVLGAAPINTNVLSTPPSAEATFEAFTTAIPEGKFGGTNPNDDSGKIKYVRIEFGGFNFVADREFNNLTLCGVGSATEIDFVQVHKGQDDGIEFFGGTVNVKHIVSSQNEDDGFDTDNGWQGKAQFVIVQNISHPATLPEASNGYESDNHGTAASFRADPRTEPTVYNVTLIGDHAYTGQKSFAAVFRRGTGGHYFNHIFMNFPQGPEFRDAETLEQLNANKLEIRNSMFFGNDATPTNLPVPQATGDIDESLFLNAARAIQFNVDPGLSATGILDKVKPNFKPVNGAASLTGGATPPNDGFFDTSATFIGAIGAEDWTETWTAYPQN
ncbi:MAG: hypothetical protein KF773_10290 [Deltaproteobacteria bacterium]|nr:hypothetical protein [Deltaproteobacteria bacterium]